MSEAKSWRLEGRSRMRREFHVRFCEGGGVRFPSATRLVMGFQYREDAEAFQQALEERMRKFGLELNAEKARLIEFGRFAAENRAKCGEGKPETFEFLGFIHICARRRKDGRFTVRRKTSGKRMQRKVQAIARELRYRRHSPVSEQGRWLASVVRGYYGYHAVPDNIRCLNTFQMLVARAWLRALRRRSQKGRRLTWARMQKLLETWLPRPRILHPYPNQRFCVTHPR